MKCESPSREASRACFNCSILACVEIDRADPGRLGLRQRLRKLLTRRCFRDATKLGASFLDRFEVKVNPPFLTYLRLLQARAWISEGQVERALDGVRALPAVILQNRDEWLTFYHRHRVMATAYRRIGAQEDMRLHLWGAARAAAHLNRDVAFNGAEFAEMWQIFGQLGNHGRVSTMEALWEIFLGFLARGSGDPIADLALDPLEWLAGREGRTALATGLLYKNEAGDD